MEYSTVDILKQELGYIDLRSIRKWLSERGIAMFKIGKKFCVLKEEYEFAKAVITEKHLNIKNKEQSASITKAHMSFEAQYRRAKPNNIKEKAYQPSQTEQDFLMRLQKALHKK